MLVKINDSICSRLKKKTYNLIFWLVEKERKVKKCYPPKVQVFGEEPMVTHNKNPV